LLSLLLLGAIVWSLASINWRGPIGHAGGGAALFDFVQALFPPELSAEFLLVGLLATWQTVTFAVASITLAVLIGFPLGVMASGTLAGSPRGKAAMVLVRLLLASLRSVHELVWAVLFVAAFGFSSLTAILAIALPYAGILGRVYAERLNDAPERPLIALRTGGASPVGVLLYGRLPMAFPDLLSYSFYRFECTIRAAAIMSFIGIRGLGFEIQLSLQDLMFGQVWTLMLFLVGLVVLVDLWSSKIRRSLAS
jgi:phosphonate transport system permease protein